MAATRMAAVFALLLGIGLCTTPQSSRTGLPTMRAVPAMHKQVAREHQAREAGDEPTTLATRCSARKR